MKGRTKGKFTVALAAMLLASSGCTVSEKPADTAATAAAAAASTPAPQQAPVPVAVDSMPAVTQSATALRVEVDLAARKLHLYENGAVVASHPVAVGSAKWPTKTGEWTIRQVVFNPEWTPPDESWAEERKPRQPGDPLNPLGHAQLIYDPPRTVHGTNQPASIGKAVSHGSIRMANADIVALGKRILTATGAGKDDAFYARAAQQRTEKHIIDLPTPVPIRVF